MNTDVTPSITKSQITSIVFDAIRDANQLRSPENQIDEDVGSRLFGGDGKLDSLSLVALLMDIEEMLLDVELEVSLSSEDAMSQKKSPYRDVTSLVDYIFNSMNQAS